MEQIALILPIIIGLIVCFFGYRLKRVAFMILWFFIGYTLMSHITPVIFANWMPAMENAALWQTVINIGVGLIAAMMGLSLEKLCVFALCVLLAVTIAVGQFGLNLPAIIVGVIVGVIAGCIAVSIMKPAIIVLTAIGGSQTFVSGIIPLITAIPLANYYLILTIIVAVAGALFQFKNTKNIE